MRTILIAAIAGVVAHAAAGVERSRTVADQPVSIEYDGTRLTGVLRLPDGTPRPAVVLLATGGDPATLGASLAAERVASLRLDTRSMDPAVLAQWIAFLRNDERFPLVTMFADGPAMEPAIVAARAARADGIATHGDTALVSGELARMVASVKSIEGRSDAEIARQIAAFAQSVPPLGRRGTSQARTSRRISLRHVLMSSVGSVRVSIEWGQPTMRGRTIWGGLVEWGRVWMPGADEATVLTTDGPVTIGTVSVPAGDHTFYTLPSPDRFQLLISRDVGQFHTVYDSSLVIGRADMNLQTKSDSTEGLTFAIKPTAEGQSANLTLTWDQREYGVRLTTSR